MPRSHLLSEANYENYRTAFSTRGFRQRVASRREAAKSAKRRNRKVYKLLQLVFRGETIALFARQLVFKGGAIALFARQLVFTGGAIALFARQLVFRSGTIALFARQLVFTGGIVRF